MAKRDPRDRAVDPGYHSAVGAGSTGMIVGGLATGCIPLAVVGAIGLWLAASKDPKDKRHGGKFDSPDNDGYDPD